MRTHKYYIGIDTGVNTGFGLWLGIEKKLSDVTCLKIHTAMAKVQDIHMNNPGPGELLVRVEDARLRTWIPKGVGREQLQGAGSIKRDAGIWEDFLKDLGIEFEMVAPKNNKTKLDADQFARITGWKGKTNEHARDGAMLVFGL